MPAIGNLAVPRTAQDRASSRLAWTGSGMIAINLALLASLTLQQRYSHAIESRYRAKQWKNTLRLFQSMERHSEPDEQSRRLTISACGRGKAWREALALLESPDAGVGAHTAAINACGLSGEWQAALDVLERMRLTEQAPKPTLLTYTTAITACGRAREWRPALALVDELTRDGLKPTPAVHNAALAACDRAGAWEAAVVLLDRMRRDGTANAASVNTALRACSRSGQYEQARRLLENRGRALKGQQQQQKQHDHLAHLSGLRKIDGKGAGARARAKSTRWVLGVLNCIDGKDLEVALQPDRAAGRNCLKIIFIDASIGRKVAFLLIENESETQRSALRGLKIDDAMRGKGLSKVLLGAWLLLCEVGGLTPAAATINKPLLSYVLERTYHFKPEGKGGVEVLVSGANRRRDCVLARGDENAATVHVGTAFRAPSAAKLRKAVRGVLRLDHEEQANGGATLSVEPEAEDLRRALLAGELSDL